MRKLATYSIETDHTVRLDFVDGARLRVPVAKLGLYLHAPDLQRVQRAVKLRRQFISRHMPKLFVGIATAGLISAAIVAPGSLQRLVSPPTVAAPTAVGSPAAKARPLPVAASSAQPSPVPSRPLSTVRNGAPAPAVTDRPRPLHPATAVQSSQGKSQSGAHKVGSAAKSGLLNLLSVPASLL